MTCAERMQMNATIEPTYKLYAGHSKSMQIMENDTSSVPGYFEKGHPVCRSSLSFTTRLKKLQSWDNKGISVRLLASENKFCTIRVVTAIMSRWWTWFGFILFRTISRFANTSSKIFPWSSLVICDIVRFGSVVSLQIIFCLFASILVEAVDSWLLSNYRL